MHLRRIALIVASLAAATFSVAALAQGAAKDSKAPDAKGPDAKAPVDDKATKEDYELDASKTVREVRVGAEAPFSVVIKPKRGKRVQPDAPLEVTFKEARGVKPAKGKLSRSDVADKKSAAPEVKTTLRGVSKGNYNLEASVSFFICTDVWCERVTDRVTVPITVTE
jgi:hypothetical protein